MCFLFINNKDHTVSSLYEGQKGTTRTCKFVRNENGKIVTEKGASSAPASYTHVYVNVARAKTIT